MSSLWDEKEPEVTAEHVESVKEVSVVVLADDEIEKNKKDLEPIVRWAESLVVDNQEKHDLAMRAGQVCELRAARYEKRHDGNRKKAYDLWKGIVSSITDVTDPLRKAGQMVEAKARKWKRDEDERRRLEALKIQKENEKALADQRLNQAEDLVAKGRPDLADAILDAPIVAPASPIPQVELPKGSSEREKWVYKELPPNGFMLLVKAVAEGKAPITLLTLNKVAIGGMARSLKTAFNVPGYRAFDEGTTAHDKKGLI